MNISTIRLGDVAQIKGGKRLPKGVNLQSVPNSHPYIRVRDLNNKWRLELDEEYEYVDDNTQSSISRYVVSEGDIILSIVGTIGIISFVGNSLHGANLTENCVKITNIIGIDPIFLFYYLKSPEGIAEITKGTVGAVQAKLPIKNIQSLAIRCPEFNIQQRIGSIFYRLDEKIENNKKINHHLEQMAQAIFKSWFVDFEPFGGVMPSDWREGVLSDICSYNTERVAVSSLTLDTYISTENMCPNKKGVIRAASLPTTPQTTAFVMGDTLISNIRPYFKKIVFCGFAGGCSTDVLCFRPKKRKLAHYVFNVLFSDKFFDFMVAGSKGTKMPRGDKQQIMNYHVVLPSSEALTNFIAIVLPLTEKRLLLAKESNRLAELRDALLPRLMSGELSIPDLTTQKKKGLL